MNNNILKKSWNEKYSIVKKQIENMKSIKSVATAFNTNIDAIYKVNGRSLEQLVKQYNVSLDGVENSTLKDVATPSDIIKGIVKCFSRGIAEEWIIEDIEIYNWLDKNIGYERLQMGGQGGIIANALALLRIQKVIAHTNSLPEIQAKQFLDLDNLLSFDENGELKKASSISRNNDLPLIHWIIEFDKGDEFTIDGKNYKCPKSNRFIATYDPMNMNLVMDENFISYVNNNPIDFLILSGFNPLLESNNGLGLIGNAVDVLKKWKKTNEGMIIHLEVASTQDKVIRKAIVDKLIPLSHSIGLNERETIDVLEVMGEETLAKEIENETSACNLYKAIMHIMKKINPSRIQLHMFGLYLTIQQKDFKYTPEMNLKGMISASVVSSSKALNGELSEFSHTQKALGYEVSDIGLNELINLSNMLNKPELLENGVCEIDGYMVSAIPTILIDKPQTLVGMGDTISSVSLLGGW